MAAAAVALVRCLRFSRALLHAAAAAAAGAHLSRVQDRRRHDRLRRHPRRGHLRPRLRRRYRTTGAQARHCHLTPRRLDSHAPRRNFNLARATDLLAIPARHHGARHHCRCGHLHRRRVAAGTRRPHHELLRQRHGARRLYRPHLRRHPRRLLQLARQLPRARRRLARRSRRGRCVAAPRSPPRCTHPAQVRLPSFPHIRCRRCSEVRRLVATFAVGFNVLFSLVGVFTWITFYLSAAPFSSLHHRTQLTLLRLPDRPRSSLPAAGYLITRVGLRAGIGGAMCCSIGGVLLTLAHSLPIVIIGLAMLSSGVFIAQTASQSHLRVAAPPGARVTAAGIYITCYYLGGTAAGVVPGAFWAFGKWPACVAFIVCHADHCACHRADWLANADRQTVGLSRRQVPHCEALTTIREPERQPIHIYR